MVIGIREHLDAARIATATGTELLALRRALDASGRNADALRKQADRLAHELISEALAQAYPGDPVLSEETSDTSTRLAGRRVWIVDPLDGTREFGEFGRTDWAIQVALVYDGHPVVGAVALPARHLTLSSEPPWPRPQPATRRPRVLVSRTRPPRDALTVAQRLRWELVGMGSAGAKAMAIVLGEADAYLHAGGQHEWDSAAPVAVAVAAGLHASRLDGSPLRYNQATPCLPDLLICRIELAEEILGTVSACLADVRSGPSTPPQDDCRATRFPPAPGPSERS